MIAYKRMIESLRRFLMVIPSTGQLEIDFSNFKEDGWWQIRFETDSSNPESTDVFAILKRISTKGQEFLVASYLPGRDELGDNIETLIEFLDFASVRQLAAADEKFTSPGTFMISNEGDLYWDKIIRTLAITGEKKC